jgi:DNA modification methylase
MPDLIPATKVLSALPKGITVLLGDSRQMDDAPVGRVNLFITSPPYWNLKKYGESDAGEVGHGEYEEYLEDMNKVWTACYGCAAEHAVLIINVNSRRHAKRFYPIAFDIAARIKGWRLWDHAIWYIPNALPQPNHYMERLLDNKYESCLVFTKDGSTEFKFHKPRVPQKYLVADPRARKKNERGRCLGNILRIPAYRPPNVKQMSYHVAAYPEELVAFFMECYTDPGDTVLDPFLGSGTTLKVARVMGRKGVGYELHHEFEPLIRARIAEEWAVPDWRDIDLLHSSSMEPGITKPRKVQFLRNRFPGGLFSGESE